MTCEDGEDDPVQRRENGAVRVERARPAAAGPAAVVLV